ncbi:brefeldin A resistance BFR1 (maintenance of normal ploidy) [Fusarium coicis]|nr:brefeldin A resistance BFR1 (maintenance of normal ploidy) [Fusarium coicis]
MPNKNKDEPNPTQKRRQELIAQANEIRQKQAGGKNARSTKLDQIKRLDEQVRSRINEQKAAKSKVPFKSLEDLDRQIASLDNKVNSGTMKLVDEKKALSDISSLRKMRKNFGQLDDSQKQIDDLRAKIKEIKDSMDDPEQKALSDQYNKIQAEIDAIKAEQDEAYKGLSSLRDERSKLQAEQQEKYTAIRKLKDDYYGQKKAYQAYDREARERYREKQRAEQERYHQERKKAEAERRLGDASDPAYLDEIRRAHSLLQFLDPNHKVEKGPLMADTGLGAQAQRSVDESGLKGTKLLRKEDRDEEYAPAVKKGKKGKKTAHGGSSNKFNVPPAVVEDCAAMGIDPPMSAADIPAVAEKVRAKLDFWKKDQDAQTQRNIEKAKKEIAELEAAEANGDQVEQTTADLKETSIADKQES